MRDAVNELEARSDYEKTSLRVRRFNQNANLTSLFERYVDVFEQDALEPHFCL